MILVTSYENPDLDGTACAVALAELLIQEGEEALAGIFGNLHREAEHVMRTFNLERPLDAALFIDQVDEIILTDASDLRGLSPLIDPQKVTTVIDHRKDYNPDDFPNADFQIELVGSAATLVTEQFIERGFIPGKTAVYLLAGAIVSNTVNFQNKVTTQRDREAFDWLKNQRELPEDFVQQLFESKSTFTPENLFVEIEHDAARFEFGDKHIGIAQLEMVNAQAFMSDFQDQLIEVLRALHQKNKIDYGFLSIVDIDQGRTIFVCEDEYLKNSLSQATGVEWQGYTAYTNGMMMRKEIVPLLRGVIS
ncbi:DHH family phosphoesterase [Candidatus Uhrbacteria bacterium]|nr:DHH family phosphoesterase [Candidatus Uhrbacteria bacterium]